MNDKREGVMQMQVLYMYLIDPCRLTVFDDCNLVVSSYLVWFHY